MLTDKGWLPDSVNPTINECDEVLEKSRNWQDLPLEDIDSDELDRSLEPDLVKMETNEKEDESKHIDFEKYSKKQESLRSLSESCLKEREDPAKSQENPNMSKLMQDKLRNN